MSDDRGLAVEPTNSYNKNLLNFIIRLRTSDIWLILTFKGILLVLFGACSFGILSTFVKLAYEAAEKGDLQALLLLDNECNAIKCPKEIRQASQKLGLRLIKIFKRRDRFPFMEAFEKADYWWLSVRKKLNVFSSFRPGYSEQAFGFTHINPFEFRAKLSFKSAANKPTTSPFPNG